MMRKTRTIFGRLCLTVLPILPAVSLAVDTYDPSTGVVHMPVVSDGVAIYEVQMRHLGDLVFQVTSAESSSSASETPDTFNSSSGILHMPAVTVGPDTFEVQMRHQGNLVFSVVSADAVTPNETSNAGSSDASALVGQWKKPCGAVDQNDEDTFYDIVVLNFTQNTFDSSILNYVDSACTVPFSEAPNPTASGTFMVGDNITTSDGVTAFEFDSHINQFNGAPFDIDDFNIIYINGDSLYSGDDTGHLDASSAQSRPDTLEYNRIYYRQ